MKIHPSSKVVTSAVSQWGKYSNNFKFKVFDQSQIRGHCSFWICEKGLSETDIHSSMFVSKISMLTNVSRQAGFDKIVMTVHSLMII